MPLRALRRVRGFAGLRARGLAVAFLVVSGCGDARSDATGATPIYRSPLIIRSSVDRTAAWVGDPVTYTIEVVCSPGYDINEDDLARDRLPLEGLEVRAADTARQARDDGTVRHLARFQLASYTPERERLRIGPMSIPYYRRQADGRTVDRLPVGSVEVRAEDIALRSTLPNPGETVIRTPTSPQLLPRFVRLLYPFGIALAVLPVVTIVGALAARARRWSSVEAGGPEPQGPTDYRLALDEIRQAHDQGDSEAVRQAFTRLDRLLREFLADGGMEAKSLTPDELESRAGAAGNMTPQRGVAGVLRECERARYAGPNQPPSRDRLERALDDAATVVVSAGGQGR